MIHRITCAEDPGAELALSYAHIDGKHHNAQIYVCDGMEESAVYLTTATARELASHLVEFADMMEGREP